MHLPFLKPANRRRSPSQPDEPHRASDYATASAINGSGAITGGMLLNGTEQFHATLLDRGNLSDWGTFGGPASMAYGLNDQSEAVGQSDTAEVGGTGDYISLAFIADGEGVRRLGLPAGYRFSQAFGINNRGLIVGWVYNLPRVASAPDRAMLFRRDGTTQELGTLGGATSIAFGLNDSGQIVGRSRTASGEQHAFVWEDGAMRDLGTLGGNFSVARAINSRGWIVGASRRAVAGPPHGFVIRQGAMRALGTLGGDYSEAFAINDAGQIVGVSDTAAGEHHAVAWIDDIGTDLGTLGGSSSIALGVNARGDIVGESETASGEVHAFLYRDGTIFDLTLGSGVLPGGHR